MMKIMFLLFATTALASVSGNAGANAGRKLAAYDYVPSCYEPQTLLSCGAVTGLECYDAGGSDANCPGTPGYFCCTPPPAESGEATGRKLADYNYKPSCYEPQTMLSCGAQTGLECYDAGGSDADCASYFCCTPPAGSSTEGHKLAAYDYKPSCYEPQTLLSCGAQTGLECYDAGGSDADCDSYFCCTPPAAG